MKMPAWPITTEDKGYAVHLLFFIYSGGSILLFLVLENAHDRDAAGDIFPQNLPWGYVLGQILQEKNTQKR